MLESGVKEVLVVGLPVLAVYDRFFLHDSWDAVRLDPNHVESR